MRAQGICKVKPVLQALLLADHVYQDKDTGKKIVAGIFNRMLRGKTEQEIEKLPSGEKVKHVLRGQAGSPYAFISLTEIRGLLPFELRYVDLSDNRVCLRTTFTVDCKDPLATVELSLAMPRLPTPHEGVYALELLCNDEPLGSLRITVESFPEHEEEKPE